MADFETITDLTLELVGEKASFSVPIYDDILAEGDETFTIRISLLPTDANIQLNPQEANVTIVDNDRK